MKTCCVSDDLSGDMLAPSWPNLVFNALKFMKSCTKSQVERDDQEDRGDQEDEIVREDGSAQEEVSEEGFVSLDDVEEGFSEVDERPSETGTEVSAPPPPRSGP